MHAAFEYLRKRQPPKIRFLHIVVLLTVISQITVSNFMGFARTGEISRYALKFYATWTHITTGLTLLPIASVFVLFLMQEHGFRNFFPYFFGDYSQLTNDINKLRKGGLPDPEPGGLAAIVEGLGLCALFSVLLSGLTWFLAWKYDASWSHYIKQLHKYLTTLIEIYIVGHGGMGLVHIYLAAKNRCCGGIK